MKEKRGGREGTKEKLNEVESSEQNENTEVNTEEIR